MTITRVQHKYKAGTVNGNPSTVTITLDNTPTVGNILIATVHIANRINLPTLTCTNVAWTIIQSDLGVHSTISPTGVYIFVGTYTTTPSNTVTLTYATNGPYGAAALNVMEYSGVSATPDKTAASGTAGDDSTWNTSNTGTTDTTTFPNELWIGAIFAYPRAISQSNFSQSNPQYGFTLVHQGWLLQTSWGYGVGDGVLEKIVSSTGKAISGTIFSQSAFYDACIATFPASVIEVNVSDIVQVTDAPPIRNKILQLIDSAESTDSLSRPTRCFPVADFIQLLEAISRDKQFKVADSVGAVDIFMHPQRRLDLSELVAVTEALRLNKTVKVADLAALFEVLTCGKTFSVAEAAALTDAIIRDKAFTVEDSAEVAESVYRNKQFTVADSAFILDNVMRGRIVAVYEAVQAADSLVRNKILTLTDAAALVDAVLAEKTLLLNEQVTLAEALQLNKTLTLTDVVTLAELIGLTRRFAVADAVHVADFIEKTRTRLELFIADAIGVADNVFRNKQVNLNEVIQLAETVAALKTLRVFDFVTLQDVALFFKLFHITDNVAVFDSASVPTRVKQVLDQIRVFDGLTINKVLQVSDQVLLVEVATSGVLHIKLVIGADVIDISDIESAEATPDIEDEAIDPDVEAQEVDPGIEAEVLTPIDIECDNID